jgi:DNA-directed RNA polymerase specialized sigma24 family protein
LYEKRFYGSENVAMEELQSLVIRTRSGDLAAYEEIVRRFQDMALGYTYSIPGDFHHAEDAAQEAFIQAYRDLAQLREPAAFPGWFRTIVFRQCDRTARR